MGRTLLVAAVAIAASTGIAAAQDAAKGKQVFVICGICHQVGEDAANMLGPPLNGLDGRRAGSLPDYPYSAAMIAAGKTGTPASKGPIVWNEATFSQYIANPQAMIPNIKMAFAGITGPDKDQKIKDLWAYLSQFNADGTIKTK
jgi:cytochrome c